jgi:L-asparaginase II
MKPALLLKAKRANLVEREHYGFIVVVDKNENIISKIGNDNNIPFFPRSCAKPFQALPIVTSDTFKRFNLNLKELAICSSSHSGSSDHLNTVRSVLNKINLAETDLLCGAHSPLDKEEKNYLIKHSLIPSNIHNNCSGKHSGMLAVCINNNWDIKNYLDFNHPLQVQILDIIEKYCNIDEKLEPSIDGCSTPIYALPLHKLGTGYLRLFLSNEAKLIRKAFIENPVLIGGKESLDSSIMEVSKGKLIAKNGAEGLCVITNLEKELSLVVKIMDADSSVRSLVAIECLKQLNWLSQEKLNNSLIKNLSNTSIKTCNNAIVGEIEFTFTLLDGATTDYNNLKSSLINSKTSNSNIKKLMTV